MRLKKLNKKHWWYLSGVICFIEGMINVPGKFIPIWPNATNFQRGLIVIQIILLINFLIFAIYILYQILSNFFLKIKKNKKES